MSNIAVGHAFRRRLPAMEKWLLVLLAEYADGWGDSVFPGLDELADQSGMSRSTVKRTLAELERRIELVRMTDPTPVSPAIYRIVCVPAPTPDQDARPAQVTAVLRRLCVHVFHATCEYCGRPGSKELGPDDKPWIIDLLDSTYRGGGYTPDNVTLCCRACKSRGKTRRTPALVRTLVIAQQEGRSQPNASPADERGIQVDTPSRMPMDGGGIQPEPSGGSSLSGGSGQPDTPGGSNVTPDPVSDPVSDPVPTGRKAGAPPRPTAPKTENPLDNVAVLTKLVHEMLDEYHPPSDELVELVKLRAAGLRIAYDSQAVSRAIDSADYQRVKAGKRPSDPSSPGAVRARLEKTHV